MIIKVIFIDIKSNQNFILKANKAIHNGVITDH